MLLFTVALVAAGADMVSETVPQDVADRFGAKRLDGTSPTYQVRTNASNTKWILFLEGGGWCFGPNATTTIKQCGLRAGFTPLDGSFPGLDGSFPEEFGKPADFGGLMGESCDTNPYFCEFNLAFLHYRDGASFGGNRVDPIPMKFKNGSTGAQMWMRERPIFDAVVSDLQTRFGMAAATEVILEDG